MGFTAIDFFLNYSTKKDRFYFNVELLGEKKSYKGL